MRRARRGDDGASDVPAREGLGLQVQRAKEVAADVISTSTFQQEQRSTATSQPGGRCVDGTMASDSRPLMTSLAGITQQSCSCLTLQTRWASLANVALRGPSRCLGVCQSPPTSTHVFAAHPHQARCSNGRISRFTSPHPNGSAIPTHE